LVVTAAEPFEASWDYAGEHNGLRYAVRVSSSGSILTAECYFRFPPEHKFAHLPLDELDEILPETVAAIYGEEDADGYYWSGVEIAPETFGQSVAFVEAFIENC
jgi:hypothetical protein